MNELFSNLFNELEIIKKKFNDQLNDEIIQSTKPQENLEYQNFLTNVKDLIKNVVKKIKIFYKQNDFSFHVSFFKDLMKYQGMMDKIKSDNINRIREQLVKFEEIPKTIGKNGKVVVLQENGNFLQLKIIVDQMIKEIEPDLTFYDLFLDSKQKYKLNDIERQHSLLIEFDFELDYVDYQKEAEIYFEFHIFDIVIEFTELKLYLMEQQIKHNGNEKFKVDFYPNVDFVPKKKSEYDQECYNHTSFYSHRKIYDENTYLEPCLPGIINQKNEILSPCMLIFSKSTYDPCDSTEIYKHILDIFSKFVNTSFIQEDIFIGESVLEQILHKWVDGSNYIQQSKKSRMKFVNIVEKIQNDASKMKDTLHQWKNLVEQDDKQYLNDFLNFDIFSVNLKVGIDIIDDQINEISDQISEIQTIDNQKQRMINGIQTEIQFLLYFVLILIMKQVRCSLDINNRTIIQFYPMHHDKLYDIQKDELDSETAKLKNYVHIQNKQDFTSLDQYFKVVHPGIISVYNGDSQYVLEKAVLQIVDSIPQKKYNLVSEINAIKTKIKNQQYDEEKYDPSIFQNEIYTSKTNDQIKIIYQSLLSSIEDIKHMMYDFDLTIDPENCVAEFIDYIFVEIIGSYLKKLRQQFTFDQFKIIGNHIDQIMKLENDVYKSINRLYNFYTIKTDKYNVFGEYKNEPNVFQMLKKEFNDKLLVKVRRKKEQLDDSKLIEITNCLLKFISIEQIFNEYIVFYPEIPQTIGYKKYDNYNDPDKLIKNISNDQLFVLTNYQLRQLTNGNIISSNIKIVFEENDLKYKYKNLKKKFNHIFFDQNKILLQKQLSESLKSNVLELMNFESSSFSNKEIDPIDLQNKIQSFNSFYESGLSKENLEQIFPEMNTYCEFVLLTPPNPVFDPSKLNQNGVVIDEQYEIQYKNEYDKWEDEYENSPLRKIISSLEDLSKICKGNELNDITWNHMELILFIADVYMQEKLSRDESTKPRFEFFPDNIKLLGEISNQQIEQNINNFNIVCGSTYNSEKQYILLNYGIRQKKDKYVLEKIDIFENNQTIYDNSIDVINNSKDIVKT